MTESLAGTFVWVTFIVVGFGTAALQHMMRHGCVDRNNVASKERGQNQGTENKGG